MEPGRMIISCDICGKTFTGDSEDQLIKRYRKHAREGHKIEMSQEQVRDKVRAKITAIGTLESLGR